ncbi:MAG: hypothetical protein NTY23_14275, partial [Chloroflexi bacterium]|nr:hypothetical protein [Chloroflexota bacterium]
MESATSTTRRAIPATTWGPMPSMPQRLRGSTDGGRSGRRRWTLSRLLAPVAVGVCFRLSALVRKIPFK